MLHPGANPTSRGSGTGANAAGAPTDAAKNTPDAGSTSEDWSVAARGKKNLLGVAAAWSI